MSIPIGDRRLTIDDVVRVARHGEKAHLTKEALERIKRCREIL